MNRYKTIDIARIIGVHVNTVRLYEACGLIPRPERKQNGYRVFTDLHIEHFRLARAALQVEVLQNGLRKLVVDIIKISAAGDYDKGAKLTREYIAQLDAEYNNAEEAIVITRSNFLGLNQRLSKKEEISYTRKEAAEILHVTIDTLRNWELNGLFTIKRRKNGYRIYTDGDMERLKIIRSLRCANYSLSSILRMLQALDLDATINIRKVIDTPKADDDIITACDNLLTSLSQARENAFYVASQIEKIRNMREDVLPNISMR